MGAPFGAKIIAAFNIRYCTYVLEWDNTRAVENNVNTEGSCL